MNKIKILVEGYAHKGKPGSYIASPTSTLIFHKSKTILVDPGANDKKLLSALTREGRTVADINFIYLTHYHPDHFLNIRFFPKADICDGETLWRSDKEYFYKNTIPQTDIQILKTPGHADEHTSLLVETSEYGKVCIAADVFWWEDGKQKSDTIKDLMNHNDPFANDVKALKKSREKVLKVADYIIPGHGKIFKNPTK